jgi:hypothetical protein
MIITAGQGLKRQFKYQIQKLLPSIQPQVFRINSSSTALIDSIFQLGGDSIRAMEVGSPSKNGLADHAKDLINQTVAIRT